MSETFRPQPTNGHLPHLDALRTVCMALVVPLHAYYLGFPDYAWVAVLSDSFHMAAFFLISGYLAGGSLARRGASEFHAERLRSLGLPLLTIVLLLNPPTLALHELLHRGSLDGFVAQAAAQIASGKIVLHGWFLIALLIYVALTQQLSRLLSRLPWPTVPPARRGLGLLALVTLLALPAELLWRGEEGPFGLPLFLYETLRYLWAYALGLAAWHHRALFATLHRPDPAVILVALVVWLVCLTQPPRDPLAWDLLYTLRRTSSALVLIPALLWLSQRFAGRETPLSRALSQASTTTYVVQWITLYILALCLPVQNLSPHVAFWSLTALALIAGFVLHHGLVTRSRRTAWLLTGKRPSRAQAVSSAAIPSTVGRCSTSSVQLSPPSKLPNTDPVLVPK